LNNSSIRNAVAKAKAKPKPKAKAIPRAGMFVLKAGVVAMTNVEDRCDQR
jgi:hypothetical protein